MAPPGAKRKRARAALEEPEDPDAPPVSKGLPCLQCLKQALDQTTAAIEPGRPDDAHIREIIPVINTVRKYSSNSNSVSEGHKRPLIRKRDRAVLEGPEDPDVPAVPVGPGPLSNWGGRRMPFFERVSLPSTAFTVPLTTRNAVTALRPSRAVVQCMHPRCF